MTDSLIAYYRVSTKRQSQSGLGLEAQKAAVMDFQRQQGTIVLAEYIEVESGKLTDRAELAKALCQAKRAGAILVVAKLDRLARNVAFTSALLDSGVEFICCDNPHANRLTIHILAAVAEDVQFLGMFGLLNSHLLFTREAYPTSAYQSLANFAPSSSSKQGSGNPGAAYGVPDGVCIGNPETIIAAIKNWESIGVDQLNFLMNACEVLPQEQVLESMRMFAREVMPAFAKGED